jgi:exonuclease SbcC
MRILHLADLHFRESAYDDCKASIDACIAEHRRDPFDLIAIAGDTWDGPVQNSARARFNDFLELIRGLADCAPVAMIYGTPSHDTEGSLDVFEYLDTRYGITMLRPGSSYFLVHRPVEERGEIVESTHTFDCAKLLLFGVPEPNKKWLLANQEATGKDEADLAVQGSMKALFLGLAGMRKQHQDLPCVLLYHGQVRGAKTATGYTADSGIAVTRDDLAMVGADYYALGDIHLPQQIGDIPAYYSGKLYTGNWNETNYKPGANVVEIRDHGGIGFDGDDLYPAKGKEAIISRLDFPHPQRIKIAGHWPSEAVLPSFAGKETWLELTATREEAAGIDTDKELDALIRGGALPGSKVTLNILPTETVRAGDITEKKALRDKLKIQADNSGQTYPDSVYAKADELEREAAAHGAVLKGAHLRINKLVLRGAIGIWKNQKKDEVVLDLDKYGPGVIALVGSNGAGKSTILENLHPWPQLLTRSGKLTGHFRLKDSCRDLYFTDELTGTKYRAYITIRADIESGAAEYYLYLDNGGTWEPLPGINGRKEPYEQAVNELFGSMLLYLRTAFQTQRPTKDSPDLSETTKGERKELFAELSGMDYLDTYRSMAKGNADAIDSELVRIRAVIEAAADVDDVINRLNSEIREAVGSVKAKEGSLKEIEVRGLELKISLDNATRTLTVLERKQSRRDDIQVSLAELSAEIDRSILDMESFRRAADGRKKAEAEVKRIEALQAEYDQLKAEKAKLDEAHRKALIAHQEVLREIEVQRKEAQAQLDTVRKGKAAINQDIAVLLSQISKPIEDHCPTCKQLLPEETRRELTETRKEAVEKLEVLKAKGKASEDEEKKAIETLAAIETPPPPEPEAFSGKARMEDLESDLSLSDIDDARKQVHDADLAETRIKDAEARIKSAKEKQAILASEEKDLTADLEALPEARVTVETVQAEYEDTRIEYSDTKAEIAALNATREASEKSLAESERRRLAREQAQDEVETKESELSDWRILEKACGPDGIQALELDALAPSIAEVANRLLAVQNPRYSVEFRTQKESGKGSKKKEIETFEIYILDSETGMEQEIGTLSGGEGVWIKRAIYDAFAAIRAKNTGIMFLTVFQDETDGALDPANRMDYLRMMEAAHGESGRYQTLLITHSTELQAMVSQVIDVWALEGRQVEGVSA